MKRQKIFNYCGYFDNNGDFQSNIEELNKELKDGWSIENTLLERSLIFGNTGKTNEYTFESSEKITAPLALEKEFGEEIGMEPLRLEVGSGLISLADKEKGEKLLEAVYETRKKMFFPKIRIIDNLRLESWEYKLFSYNVNVFSGFIDDKDSLEEQASAIIRAVINYIQNK